MRRNAVTERIHYEETMHFPTFEDHEPLQQDEPQAERDLAEVQVAPRRMNLAELEREVRRMDVRVIGVSGSRERRQFMSRLLIARMRSRAKGWLLPVVVSGLACLSALQFFPHIGEWALTAWIIWATVIVMSAVTEERGRISSIL